jgi:hypothetical protein
LVGAINEAYDLGTGIASQRNIKESAAVVPVPGSAPPSTISSLLNSGTPVPAPAAVGPRRNPLARW